MDNIINHFPNNSPRFSADELLNLSIMSKVPVFIVEGWDDLPIYERLAHESDLDCEVYAPEALEDGVPGCDGVLKCIKQIRESSQEIEIEKHILGLIDRDVRPYRNESTTDPAILTLEMYSIESHYVNVESIKWLIPKFTRATNKLFDENSCDELYLKISKEFDFLYYVSLEALKNACTKDYKSLVGYKQSITAITKQNLHLSVKEKKKELDEFAATHKLTYSIETLLLICKGKWLADTFFDLLHKAMGDLPHLCKDSKIPQCQLCRAGSPQEKCLYKKIVSFTPDNILVEAYQNTGLQSLNYLKEKFKSYKQA